MDLPEQIESFVIKGPEHALAAAINEIQERNPEARITADFEPVYSLYYGNGWIRNGKNQAGDTAFDLNKKGWSEFQDFLDWIFMGEENRKLENLRHEVNGVYHQVREHYDSVLGNYSVVDEMLEDFRDLVISEIDNKIIYD